MKCIHVVPYSRVFLADPYFHELLTEANFAKNIIAIRPKPDHTHVGALREEGVAPKISGNIFSRLAEIRKFAKINVRETPGYTVSLSVCVYSDCVSRVLYCIQLMW